MSYGIGPPTRPPVSATDLWVSIAVLVATLLMGAVAAVGGLFSLAFLDYCPAPRCSADGAATAVLSSLVVGGIVGIAGSVITIVQLVRRKRAWPFAAATLVVCGLVLVGGIIGYAAATGMGSASTG